MKEGEVVGLCHGKSMLIKMLLSERVRFAINFLEILHYLTCYRSYTERTQFDASGLPAVK